MKTHIGRIAALILCALPVFAQSPAAPAPDFPDQFIAAGITFESQSTPQFASGFVAYAKQLSSGVYSYSKISETNVSIKPRPSVQTQTETGVCAYTATFFGFHSYTCGTVGGSTVLGQSGISASGTALFMRPISKGYEWGVAAGPSYSGATGALQWPVSLVFGWGK